MVPANLSQVKQGDKGTVNVLLLQGQEVVVKIHLGNARRISLDPPPATEDSKKFPDWDDLTTRENSFLTPNVAIGLTEQRSKITRNLWIF